MDTELQDTQPTLARTLAALQQELGADCVLTGDAVRERRFADWSQAPSSEPLAILRPRVPQQVATALRVCASFRQPVCVQGGLTGLAGGANPHTGEIVLSLDRLATIEDFDELGGTVIAQAGVTLQQLQTFAAEHGWFFPLDLGARGSCQLGGNAATNAGGNRVLRFGMMRESVLGLEVALADGTLLTMLDRVIKNNAGFDLKHLFIGSEGTLGVITRLALKLVPYPVSSCTVLCAVQDFSRAATLLREARRRLPEISAFELMWDDYLQASARVLQRPMPFAEPYPLYVLLETLGGDQAASVAGIERFLEEAMEKSIIADAIPAQSVDQARQLWEFRDAVSELLTLLRPLIAFDVSMAMPHMNDFVTRLRSRLAAQYPQQQHLFFGHLGDGNLHLVSGPFADEAQLEAVEHLVYQDVEKVGGSISAEHGIGVIKRPFLHHSRDQAQIALMQSLKQALDPLRILAPGRVIAEDS